MTAVRNEENQNSLNVADNDVGPKGHNDIDRQLTGKVSDLDSFPIEVGKLLLLDITQY
uniref:Uncharacterized protein n=1 Tax=Oryza sativa subsp. japonica TaxID=39947 RepID=Q6K203_ORYSJ|nr:hypothetical protein [Oryza sativa Japonica Group]